MGLVFQGVNCFGLLDKFLWQLFHFFINSMNLKYHSLFSRNINGISEVHVDEENAGSVSNQTCSHFVSQGFHVVLAMSNWPFVIICEKIAYKQMEDSN